MKIAYCLLSVRTVGGGGIQRVTVVKANALAEVAGNEVYVIEAEDDKKLPLINPISPKVHLIDLGINYYDNTTPSRWRYYLRLAGKKRTHRRRLERVLEEIKPDIVVSADDVEKRFIPSYVGDYKKIRELHLKTRSYSLAERIKSLYRFHNVKKYDRIITLTDEDKQASWRGDQRVEVIPDPVSFVTEESSPLTNKTVVAVGRLCEQKNFASLIRAFKAVAARHDDWTLEIYGDGSQRGMLQRLITELGLADNVFLMGYASDVQRKMLDASCFVLSSLFEGFGLVITEAMMCGLPVVSYACPCGPKDIISEGVDGFLIPVGDEAALADRICRLIEDKDLRLRMGRAAKEKANKYRLENVIPMWMDLFNKLLEQK